MNKKFLHFFAGILTLLLIIQCEPISDSFPDNDSDNPDNSDSDPSEITLVEPEDSAEEQSTSLTFEWNEVSGAGDYQIQVASDSTFDDTEIDETVSDTSYEASDLNEESTYFWRVQTTDNSADWSEIREFETESAGSSEPPAQSSEIVSVDNADFVVDGEPFYFAGTNAYYLPTYEKIDPSVVDDAMDAFEEAGVTVVRMWAFYDGPPQNSGDISLQPEAGEYNEEDLRHLDNVIAKGKEHGIRFVLTLVNYWDQLGGIQQYNEWAGNADGGMEYFIRNSQTQELFKDYISMLLNRENTQTGVDYKDEPAVFSWEIINEGRLSGGDPDELRDWYQDIAQFIKSEDPNHMVSTGEEGFDEGTPSEYSTDQYSNTYVLRAQEGSSYIQNTAIPEIDYGTAHWYPSEWGFGNSVDQDMINAQHAWLSDHAEIAENEGKPFVLGEYGFPGWGDDRVLENYEDLWSHAESIDMDGSLLWQFTADGTKCWEYGGNICWPDGRQDSELYEAFIEHTQQVNN